MTERGFKGVWIPREIWLHPGLTLQEKILLVEIDSLDNENGCFASNKHFADFLNIGERRVQALVKSLKEKGYISVSFLCKGETKEIGGRILKVLSPPYPPSPDPAQVVKEAAPGGEENFAGVVKETSPGGEENFAPYIRIRKPELENQESITPLNPPGPDAGTGSRQPPTGKQRSPGDEPASGDGTNGPLRKGPMQSSTEEKTNTELTRATPPGASLASLAPELEAKVQEWLQYKRERRELYKPMGLKALLTTIRKQAEQYGDQAVIALIDQSMAANYQGIIWDKLPKSQAAGSTSRQQPISFSEIAEKMERGELF